MIMVNLTLVSQVPDAVIDKTQPCIVAYACRPRQHNVVAAMHISTV